jgi:hypothetical protein
MRRAWLPGALALALAAMPLAARAERCWSPLALEQLGQGTRPELVLAQRVIEREWATRADTTWRPAPTGWKSEGRAMALSAALPGAGQLYVGERSGFFFALAEVAGWVGWWLHEKRSDDLRDEAATLAGAPADSASAWSFDRWADATNGDPAGLMALYQADREAFYDAIAGDDNYAAGWNDTGARQQFAGLRAVSDQRLRTARRLEGLVWINHVVATVDAFRAARIHNIPLHGGLGLRARGQWKRGAPGLVVAVERSF